jgi:DNA-binding transcriptional regulator LsrR (DeoR family)
MITRAELAELEQAGAEGEVLGHFFDAGGRSVEADVNRRALGLTPDDLRGKEVVAIAGGRGKAWAIAAVLESGLLTGLVTDEATARRLVERRLDHQPQTVRPPAERSAIAKMAS